MNTQNSFLLFAIPLFAIVLIILGSSFVVDIAASKARTEVYSELTQQSRVHANAVDYYISCRKHDKVLEAGLDHDQCMTATSDFIFKYSPDNKATKNILKICDLKLSRLDRQTSRPVALALNYMGF